MQKNNNLSKYKLNSPTPLQFGLQKFTVTMTVYRIIHFISITG